MREDVGFELIGDIVTRIVNALVLRPGATPASVADPAPLMITETRVVYGPLPRDESASAFRAAQHFSLAAETGRQPMGAGDTRTRLLDRRSTTAFRAAAIGEFWKSQRIRALEFGRLETVRMILTQGESSGHDCPAELRSAAPIPLASGKLLRMRA